MASPGKTINTRERSVSVNFVCQRCCQPLKLDLSFGCLEEQTVAELTSPVYPHTDVHCMQTGKVPDSEDYDVSRKVILPLKLTDSGNGFMLVSDNSLGSDSLNEHLRVSSTLFDIMSDQSDVDHPLCEECTDYLLDQMDQQLKIAEDECRDYQLFLECLKAEQEEQEDIEKIKEELEQLQSEEGRLQIELQDGEEKKQQLEKAVKECEYKREVLQLEEERYWYEYSNLNQELLLCEDEFRSAENQLHYAQAQLDKLKKTNVFNATFHIWHSGHFGTINSFRLGRLPSVPVDWSEINAAWGQTVLLLYSLAKKMNLTFQRYRLVPYGNHSFLESLDDKSKELPLYGSGGFKFLWDTKFDQAMVAFLDCLQQFKEEVEKGETGFRLPYRMEKGKIEDSNSGNTYSIKIQFNSEEQWTKALKFMLTNLKWGLAWVSSQFSNR